MKKITYEVLDIQIKDVGEAIIGKDIFCKCGICQGIVPSMPRDNAYCSCSNINLDKDIHRLFVKDKSNFLYSENCSDKIIETPEVFTILWNLHNLRGLYFLTYRNRHIPRIFPRFVIPVGFGSFFQWKALVDDRLELASLHEFLDEVQIVKIFRG